MMEACPGSLDVRSVSGTTPRQLLDALVQKRQDYLAQQVRYEHLFDDFKIAVGISNIHRF